IFGKYWRGGGTNQSGRIWWNQAASSQFKCQKPKRQSTNRSDHDQWRYQGQVIPLRTTGKTRSYPWATVLLIVANITIFIRQAFFFPQPFDVTVKMMGLVPYRMTHAPIHEIDNLFMAMFMHGGFGHLLGNMLFLWIFGDSVEDALGSFRYLLFYLVTG